MSQTEHSHVQPDTPLAVLGAGAWGTIVAYLLAQNGHQVRLWARRDEQVGVIKQTDRNMDYLPELLLPASLEPTSNLTDAIKDAQGVFMAIPSKGLRDVLGKLPAAPAFISCAKGLEHGSFKRFTQIIQEYQPGASVGVLSGPNLAKEIAAGKPAAATVASDDAQLTENTQLWLSQDVFRVYRNHDLIGVEVAGALKNIIALAAGMADELELGDNAKASIITRGLAELVRLGTHLGGERETFYGLAGMGDVIATCASGLSRNHRAGEALARGSSLADIEASGLTAEGIPTVKAVHDYAVEHGLELPISSEIYRVVYERKPVRDALQALMSRSTKAEW